MFNTTRTHTDTKWWSANACVSITIATTTRHGKCNIKCWGFANDLKMAFCFSRWMRSFHFHFDHNANYRAVQCGVTMGGCKLQIALHFFSGSCLKLSHSCAEKLFNWICVLLAAFLCSSINLPVNVDMCWILKLAVITVNNEHEYHRVIYLR